MRQKISCAFIPPTEDDSCLLRKQLGGFSAHKVDKNEGIKWHKRHVTIDTPCPLKELESIISTIGSQGWWSTATVTVEDDRIVVEYGKDEHP